MKLYFVLVQFLNAMLNYNVHQLCVAWKFLGSQETRLNCETCSVHPTQYILDENILTFCSLFMHL